jgi:prepilin-type N-terminal cleavage/methylation domain-containing protein
MMFQQDSTTKKGGFTIIELLIVAAIIGLLSSITLAALGTARTKALDSRRGIEMRNLIIALNIYFQDKNKFPCQGHLSDSKRPGFLSPLLTGKYYPQLPKDPINDETYFYEYQTVKLVYPGPCGQIAHLTYQIAPNASCIAGAQGVIVTNAQGKTYRHCHIFIPQTPTCNLSDPYWFSGFPPEDCGNYIDDVDDF